MCGIAGIVGHQPGAQLREYVARMIDALHHRGPDGVTVTERVGVCFGHARLKVIDLATGDQPMRREDWRAAVVFNGEIYNYLELRTELEKQGYSFRTTSDTEVLLASYREWGE